MKRIHIALIGLLLCTSLYAQELEKFREGQKFGFRDAAGNVIVPAKYDDVGDFSEGLAPVMILKEEKMLGVVLSTSPIWGYIDKTGKEAIPLKYTTHVGSFSGGLARVGDDFIDKTGVEIFQPVLDPYLKQANSFLKKVKSGLLNQNWDLKESVKLAKREGSFNVKSPYLIVSTRAAIEILNYSENNIDPQMMNRVKTLIFKEDMGIYRDYQEEGSAAGRTIRISSYGTTLLYFDMENKQYLGRDFIEPAWLPTFFKDTRNLSVHQDFFPIEEAVQKVESRLGTRAISADQSLVPLATIKVIRRKSMLGAVVPYQVFINDKFVGLVNNGKTLEIPVFTSHNVVTVGDGIGPFEGNFTVDLEKGGSAEVYVKARKFVEK